MTTLTVRLSSFDDLKAEVFAKAERAKAGKVADTKPTLGSASYEDMRRILAPLRLEIVKALTGQGPLAIREVARRVNREVQAVHRGIMMLINCGVLDRHEKGVSFPCDGIHFEFDATAKSAA
ncbi:transcriptional regulator [Agrobacterium tumefaciens]|uniref:HVO_A0114 family putative DNA-binding protein n=1 Tax=Agrobacterium tumefaciens TaxID=358 RepID=UPI001571BC1E|nr:transcriptional regulator [Agrobacterium tumefaciens]NSZ72092.1 transcriptional regulator [Agrobacterium tumefaciens]